MVKGRRQKGGRILPRSIDSVHRPYTETDGVISPKAYSMPCVSGLVAHPSPVRVYNRALRRNIVRLADCGLSSSSLDAVTFLLLTLDEFLLLHNRCLRLGNGPSKRPCYLRLEVGVVG